MIVAVTQRIFREPVRQVQENCIIMVRIDSYPWEKL